MRNLPITLYLTFSLFFVNEKNIYTLLHYSIQYSVDQYFLGMYELISEFVNIKKENNEI